MKAMWISCLSSIFKVAYRRDEVVVVMDIWVRARSRACTSMCEPRTCCEGLGSSICSTQSHQHLFHQGLNRSDGVPVISWKNLKMTVAANSLSSSNASGLASSGMRVFRHSC